MPVSQQNCFSACVGNESPQSKVLVCLNKIKVNVLQVGKEDRNKACSFVVKPSRNRKILLIVAVSYKWDFVSWCFLIEPSRNYLPKQFLGFVMIVFFLISKSCRIPISVTDQGKNVVLLFPRSRLNVMHLQGTKNCCHFQMKYGSVVLGTCSAYKGKKSAIRLLLINVTVLNDPEKSLVLSQELPLISRFCHERVVKKLGLTLCVQ